MLLRTVLSIALCLVPTLLYGSAQVRVAHLSPDAPSVDVRVDGALVLEAVPFGAFSDYLTLPAGTYQIEVLATGTTTPAVIDAPVTVANDTAYTIAATGLLGQGDLSPLILIDDFSALSTDAKVRVTHASPDAPAVDVAVAGGPVVFPNLSFRDSSAYEVLAPGTYDLDLRLAGTSTVALPIGPVTVEAGTVIDVFARGLLGDSSLTVVSVLTRGAGPAKVRVAHLSPDAPAVDVWVDGALTLASVSFPTVSGYLELAPGTYSIQVRAAAPPNTVVIDESLTFFPGVAYSVAATGLIGQGDLLPLPLTDDRTSDPGDARVRFVHLGPDAPAVDIAVTGGPVLFANREFRESSDYIDVAPGTYDLEVRLAGTTTVALPLPGVTVEAGTNLSVFAIGLLSDSSLTALVAVDIDDRFRRGDVDRNGTIDLSDAIEAIRFSVGLPTEGLCADAVDLNDNGHVAIDDPIFLLNYLFGGGAEPAAPFLDVGTDPTGDSIGCDR